MGKTEKTGDKDKGIGKFVGGKGDVKSHGKSGGIAKQNTGKGKGITK